MIWLILGAVFLSLLCLFLALRLILFRDQDRRQSRTRQRIQTLAPDEAQAQEAALRLMRDQSLSSIPVLDKVLRRLPRMIDLQTLLDQAGRPCNLGVLILMSCTLACLGILLGLLQGSGLLCLFMAGLGLAGPVMWLRRMRTKRLAAFDEQFPEAVDLIARALRAGHSLSSAMQMISDELEDPVAGEFGRVFADYSYGKTLSESLMGLVHRVELKDVKFFATAVVMQRETGGNLTEILDNIGHIIRERFRLMRQVKALSAEGRLSGRVLSALAPALLIILWFASPKYLALMFNHPLGIPLLVGGACFQILGMLTIRQLVKFKM